MKRQISKNRLLFLCLLFTLGIVGCGSRQQTVQENGAESTETNQEQSKAAEKDEEAEETLDETQAEGLKKETIIGISFPAESDARWREDGEALAEDLREKGYDLQLSYAENVDRQQEDIEAFVKQGVSLLIVAAIEENSLKQQLDEAAEKSIPVIAYDCIVMDTDAIDYYVMFHHYLTGRIQGEYVKEHFDWDTKQTESIVIGVRTDEAEYLHTKAVYQGIEDELILLVDYEQFLVSEKGDTTGTWKGADIVIYQQSNETAEMKSDEEALKDECFIVGLCKSHGQKPTLSKEKMVIYQDTKREVEVSAILAEAILEGKEVNAELTKGLNYDCYYNESSYDNGTGIIPGFLIEPEQIDR